MQTRSIGSHNLIPIDPEIKASARKQGSKRRQNKNKKRKAMAEQPPNRCGNMVCRTQQLEHLLVFNEEKKEVRKKGNSNRSPIAAITGSPQPHRGSLCFAAKEKKKIIKKAREVTSNSSNSSTKTGKHSTSKRKSYGSNGKKTVPRSAQAKRKEVDINYYDIDFNSDAKFKEKYEMLFRRGLVATKYCDIDALKTLRIEEDNFASLKVHMFPNPSTGESSITFQLFNEDHTWTLVKFNEALGIPIGGLRVTPQHWNEKELWRTISIELDYDSKRSSVTSINHPAICYVFKVFSNTIFGRQEGSKVRKDEIFMLHHMLHATPIDTGAFLIHQLQSTANNVNTGGKIVQGGFITRIETYLVHREQLIRDGFVVGADAVEVPPSWLKKKDDTTLCRIQKMRYLLLRK
ncbi:DNA-directed RNA polymerase subunit beta [Bienertia sinuspersici]